MTIERQVARLLAVGSYASVVLLAAGFVLLLLEGRSPLDGGPNLDPGVIVADVVALRSAGLLWLGLLAAIGTPAGRVVLALVGYLRRGERAMAVVAALVLAVIALSVVLALGTEA